MNIPPGLPFYSSTALQKWLHSLAMRPFLRLVDEQKFCAIWDIHSWKSAL
ncbi:MAG: hypothetical protein WC091_15250 [Sulfuricellaceae bacterium]